MSIRARLTLWFVAALAAIVVAASIATYFIVRSELRGQATSAAQALARAAAAADPEGGSLDRLAGPGDRIWLTDRTGRVVASTFGAPGKTIRDLGAFLRSEASGGIVARASSNDGGVAIVFREETLGRTLSTLRWVLVGVGLGGLLIATAAGWALAVRALRPVDRMRGEVDSIPGDALDRRLVEGRPDELGRLARAFNRLLGRAERAAKEQERFVADASHELRNPVTALEGHARIVARAIERGDLRQAGESAQIVLDETRHLSLTLRELLALAEAGATGPALGPTSLDGVVAEACEEMHAHDPDRPLELELVPATVAGDAGRLRELTRILLDNAFKYSPAGTPVSVQVTDALTPTLIVRDSGPGLAAADRARAFDRFYRGAAAHGVSGSGLGLAIARAICERHGATLSLDEADGGGTAAVVRFAQAAVAPRGLM